MRSPIIRVGMAIATASVAMLPLAASAQFSGTNGQIYFQYTNSDMTRDIAAANSDGSQGHTIAIAGTAYLSDPTISPDGTKLAYIKETNVGSSWSDDLVLANADGTSPIVITTIAGPSMINGPKFSSDNASIFFNRLNTNSTSDGIYKVTAAVSSTPSQLIMDVVSPLTQHHGVVVTATKLYYIKATNSGSSVYEIDSANIDGTNQATLYTQTDPSKYIDFLEVSPDGSKLIFGGSLGKLYVVNAADGTGFAILVDPGTSSIESASFSPDGTKLLYNSYHYSGANQIQDGAKIVAAVGTGTPVAFRTNVARVMWSSVANVASGTVTNPLVDSAVTSSSSRGGAGADPAALPAAGHTSSKAPIALAIVATLAVIGIEAGRRVRVRR